MSNRRKIPNQQPPKRPDMLTLIAPETNVIMVCGHGEDPGTVIISMGHEHDPEPDATVTLGPADAAALADWLRAAART